MGGHNATASGDMGDTQLPELGGGIPGDNKPGGGIPGDNVTLGLDVVPGVGAAAAPEGGGGIWGHRVGDRLCHCLTGHRLYP